MTPPKYCMNGKVIHVVSMVGFATVYLYNLIESIVLDIDDENSPKYSNKMGAAFWVGFTASFVYLICIIYYRCTKSRIQTAFYMHNLLKQFNNSNTVNSEEI